MVALARQTVRNLLAMRLAKLHRISQLQCCFLCIIALARPGIRLCLASTAAGDADWTLIGISPIDHAYPRPRVLLELSSSLSTHTLTPKGDSRPQASSACSL